MPCSSYNNDFAVAHSTLPDMETVVTDYYESLYRFAWSLSRSEEQARDLTQQTYLIFAKKGHTVRDPRSLKSWLFTTLYREFLKLARRNKPLETIEPDQLQAFADSTVVHQARQLQGKEAMQLLQSLDPVFREPLSLFYLDDLSYKEIAEILNIPIGTVMSRLSRGKQILKSRLMENPGNKDT
jgi:RNA polymerase sigma-70 factor (ECF subfamily)